MFCIVKESPFWHDFFCQIHTNMRQEEKRKGKGGPTDDERTPPTPEPSSLNTRASSWSRASAVWPEMATFWRKKKKCSTYFDLIIFFPWNGRTFFFCYFHHYILKNVFSQILWKSISWFPIILSDFHLIWKKKCSLLRFYLRKLSWGYFTHENR